MRRFALCVVIIAVAAGAGACDADTNTALGETENCTNDADDDGDGAIDCADADCHGHAYCLAYSEYNCDNNVDDDGDGFFDCDDTDCLQTSACDSSREWSCHDGVDNDSDGLTDCNDPDCLQACTEICDDGVDNNGNFLVDCDDPYCAGVAGCPGGSELCGNGQDDDGDGLVDCADPECADRPICTVVEICNNEIDDDGDGLNNCEDPDCAQSPYCFEVSCLDGQDNDGDNHIDCDDLDCAGALACQYGTECLPATPLPCGQPLESTTEGRLNNFSSYPCHADTFDGPERYFQFTAGRDMWLDIYLSDWDSRGLTMFATSGDPSGGCNFNFFCVTENNPGDNILLLLIDAGATLFLIVDSPANTPGGFNLWMDCTPTDEVGLCDDGLNNDIYSDGLVDCWDDDCEGDPVCDYWVSAGISCWDSFDCAPGEYCESVFFTETMTEVSFCTRNCPSVGMMGAQCATQGFGDGLCTEFHSTQGPRCVLPCAGPGAPCPPGSQCTDFITGSVSILNYGYCLPNQ